MLTQEPRLLRHARRSHRLAPGLPRSLGPVPGAVYQSLVVDRHVESRIQGHTQHFAASVNNHEVRKCAAVQDRRARTVWIHRVEGHEWRLVTKHATSASGLACHVAALAIER